MHEKLLISLTPGISLAQWQRSKIIYRELMPYHYQMNLGRQIVFLQTVFEPLNDPHGLSIIQLPNWRVVKLWGIMKKFVSNDFDLIKTNQSYRSDVFVKLALNWKKPIVIRCGMIYGERLESEIGISPSVLKYQASEKWAFENATLVQVPTLDLAQWAIQKYNILPKKIRVVPNFVDTNLFAPKNKQIDNQVAGKLTIISVGRLSPIKRFDLLIKACSLVSKVKLIIVGEGDQRDYLLGLAKSMDVDLEIQGQMLNSKLPEFLNTGDIFIISSLREGHPKSLIEAMSCGLACIGVNVPGIKNVIKNEDTGLLVNSDPHSIAGAIKRLIADPSLKRDLGKNARNFAESEFEIRKILVEDNEVINEALSI